MIIFDEIDDSYFMALPNWVGLSQVAIKDVLQQLLNP
jgi:hypothetical protein